MDSVKTIEDVIRINMGFDGDKVLHERLCKLRDALIEENAKSDFETLIGGLVWPASLESNKKLDGSRIIRALTWDDIDNVPRNLAVFDKEGDLWRFFDGRWQMLPTNTERDDQVEWMFADEIDRKTYGPWTVLYNFKD